MEELYTIICADVDMNSVCPIVITNYGALTLEQAKIELNKIYEEEKGNSENIEWFEGKYLGVLFDNDEFDKLHRKEYYLMKLEAK